ncbi:MAG TPA: hypothetical protein VIK81_02405 [Patescibacteria group bacterium]
MIESIERLRITGKTKEALEGVIREGQVDPLQIPNIPDEILANKMRAWRIWVVTLLSESQKTLDGEKSSQILYEAEKVIGRLYHHEVVKEKALEIKTDPSGNEYQMAAEMLRDEGKYYLYLARLTSNPLHLDQVISAFDAAIGVSEKGTSTNALATMEREIAKRENGEKMDFFNFKRSYFQVLTLSDGAGGDDRAAAASLMYARESFLARQFSESRVGFENFLNYSSKYRSKKQAGLQVLKEVTRPIADRIRRITL